jgi:hypothetical protein
MQRIYAEMFADALEGVVVDGTPLTESSDDFDLDCVFVLQCDDGEQFRVMGWAVNITILEP